MAPPPVLVVVLFSALAACAGRPHGPGSAEWRGSCIPGGDAPLPVAPASPPPPVAARRPVRTTHHGVAVDDDYQWLEDGADPEVRAWSDAENRYARALLDAVADRGAVEGRVRELLTAQSIDHFALTERRGTLFALERRPPKAQPTLVVLASLDADPAKTSRAVVDPTAIDPSGKTTIDFYVPSHDGKLVAVSLSSGGSENGDVHVFDVATGKDRGDVVPHVNGGTAGGSVAWAEGDKGFWFTRYPKAGERAKEDLDFYQQVYFHALGTPAEKDTYAVGKDFPRIAEVELTSSDDGKFALAAVENGDGSDYALFVHGPGVTGPNGWAEIAAFADGVKSATFGRDDRIYLLSRKGAPKGRVLAVAPTDPLAKAKEIVGEDKEATIESIAVTDTRLYLADLLGGPSRIRIAPLPKRVHGQDVFVAACAGCATGVPTPAVSSVSQIVALHGDDVVFRSESYVAPAAWIRYDAAQNEAHPTALHRTTVADMSDAEVARVLCKSKDGTDVPLNIVRKKGAIASGDAPTLLTGYGGYNVSRVPKFRPLVRMWLDQGGVFAEANLRGGGEFGEAWHDAGRLTRKQNVFDDFAACAQKLVDDKVTRPDRLAIMGGSNGGLLMGAELTQHPEMFKAVVALVGIYDMLRVELTPNGAFNVAEYGTVKDPAQFAALHAYSPLHHVKDGVRYPATLFMTGANDPRVDPFHSRKMVARLQAAQATAATATASAPPILLRTSGDTGHGMGTPLAAEIAEATDIYAFLFAQLGVSFQAGKAH